MVYHPKTFNNQSLIYEKYWMKLYLEEHNITEDKTFDFIVVDAPNWVIIVPELPSGELILIEQYRPAWRQLSVEFPGGRIEKGEQILTAARRELREESGYTANKIRKLVTSRPVSWTTQEMTVLVAEVSDQFEQELDDEENIEVLKFTPEEVTELIKSGRMQQTASIFAFTIWNSKN